MKQVKGEDCKEGLVKTMFNILAKLIKEKYYK